MATDIDRLSDLANTASSLADRSHRLDDHAEAAKAHYAAWKATKAQGKEDRPSLGESHLRRAAEHDKVASDPESYAQKNVLARAACRKADKSPSVESFRAASAAHKAAGAAWRKENPAKGVGGGDPWEPRDHDRQAQNYADQADFLEKKQAAGADGEDVAAKLEKKFDAPAAEAKA
jgi:hypothetical protein